MKKVFTLVAALLFTQYSFASLATCTSLYVGKIGVNKGTGLYRFTVTENSEDANGSNWILLSGWTKEDKKEVLSILLAAKMGQKRISLDLEGGCNSSQVQELNKIGLDAGQ